MKIPEHVPWKSTGQTLGSGGQGVVEVVTRGDNPQGPKYALKKLLNVESAQAQERFHREIEVVEAMTHPEIIRVYDHSEKDDDFQYYVMDYHEGARTLAKTIYSQPNPYYGDTLRCLDLFEQIISAIGACEKHTPKVIHRDVNPKNILVLPDGTLRLIDFGVCQFDDGMMITLVDEDVGARNYTSPECETGSDEQIGTHSDIYSASKVLWSAITSQRAFAREEPAFTSRSMSKLFPLRRETWHLTHIFEKTIRHRPDDRFRGTDDLLHLVGDLRRIILGGFPPLEEVEKRCPSCGWSQLQEYRQGYIVFGNPNPPGTNSVVCGFCGFGFVRDTRKLKEILRKRQSLY